MPQRLTVAIPTFNRQGFLRATLAGLRQQAREGVELMVVDNCSEPPVEDVVREILDGSGWTFRVVRNPVNVGLCANILRCFEVARGDWLWVLSDDDTVHPHAISTLHKVIRTQPDLVHATFSLRSLTTYKDQICISADEFGTKIKTLEFIFISSVCFHRSSLLPFFSLAENYIGSGAPHSALLLLYLLRNPAAKCGFFSAEIVEWKAPVSEHRYSKFFPISLCALLDICVGSTREHLAGTIRRATPSVFQLLIHLIRDAVRGRPVPEVKLHWKLYLRGYREITSAAWSYFVAPLWSLLFKITMLNPRLFREILERLCRIANGRAPNYDPNEVSFNSFRRLKDLPAPGVEQS